MLAFPSFPRTIRGMVEEWMTAYSLEGSVASGRWTVGRVGRDGHDGLQCSAYGNTTALAEAHLHPCRRQMERHALAIAVKPEMFWTGENATEYGITHRFTHREKGITNIFMTCYAA